MDYMTCQVQGHRFCYTHCRALLAELIEKWDDFAALLQKHHRYIRRRATFPPTSRPWSTTCLQLAGQGAACARAVRPREAAYQGRVMRYMLAAVQLLGVGWTGSRSTSLTWRTILARKGLKLNPRQLQEATTATLSAVVEAKKRPHWHLLEDATVLNSVGGAAKICEVLGVCRRGVYD